jgi:hypothetical protein
MAITDVILVRKGQHILGYGVGTADHHLVITQVNGLYGTNIKGKKAAVETADKGNPLDERGIDRCILKQGSVNLFVVTEKSMDWRWNNSVYSFENLYGAIVAGYPVMDKNTFHWFRFPSCGPL